MIVASGPSLTKGDCQLVSRYRHEDKCRVIVVNDNWRMVPNADALYACDLKWWIHHWNDIEFDGAKYTQDEQAARRFDLNHVYCVTEGVGLCLHPGTIHGGSNSGYQAINLAYHFGARRILLLGYDFQWTGGTPHWFGEHPRPLNQPTGLGGWIKNFTPLKDDLEAQGVRVVNCTRETALSCFSRSTIDVELARKCRSPVDVLDVTSIDESLYVYSSPRERASPMFAHAFASSAGGIIVTDDVPRPGAAWAGFGSPKTWTSLQAIRRAGGTWYFGDHGYFGRGEYYRITKNAFQHDGRGEPDYSRLRLKPKPWRTSGSHVVVCPPDDAIAELRGFNVETWLRNVRKRLKQNTDREIIIRDRHAQTSLLKDFADAWALVTWASNAAVEALMEGVPVFCTDDCAAQVMGLSDPVNIEYPRYPDNREEWAAVLAANQFTMSEIAAGVAWSKLNDV